MISSVLVVCVGNICRSPVGAALLAQLCPSLRVESAGIAALTGHSADETAQTIAKAESINLSHHVARQFSSQIAADFDLILALEKGHLKVIQQQAPEVGGKAMLFGHWSGQSDIADPYRKSHDFHMAVFSQLKAASADWASKLGTTAHG